MTLDLPAQHNGTAAPAISEENAGRRYFDMNLPQWLLDLAFLLSLSLTGLGLPLGNLLVVFFLLRAWNHDREGFVFMLMFSLGEYAISYPKDQWGVNLLYPATFCYFLAMCLLRKNPVLKRTIWYFLAYVASTIVLCVIAPETLSNQWRTFLSYISFGSFAMFLLCFANRPFDIHRFWNRVFSLQLTICAFYIIDGYILRGWVLVPLSHWPKDWARPSYTNLYIFIDSFPRKYPPGLFPLALLMFPMARHYKLRWWQWGIIIGALMASRTFTVITGLIVGYLLAMGTLRKYLLYGGFTFAVFTALYVVDMSMADPSEEGKTPMRIASSINQFISISEVQDDEDLATFGTGRMAQAIPKVTNIFETGNIWTGFGFVPATTTNPRFIIENELSLTQADEGRYVDVVSVEIAPVNLFLQLGFIGLAIHIIFIIALCRLVRNMKYGKYFINVMVIMIWFGLSGFASFCYSAGILICALAYAAVLLANKHTHTEKLKIEN